MPGLRCFDVHVHMDLGTDIDRVAAEARKLGCRLGISSCGAMFHQPDNDAVADAIQRHPDVVVGFGYVALGRGDGPAKVRQLHRHGFRALKAICPKKDYDDKSLYPIYAKAEELRMPILFHTGVVARLDNWAKQHDWPEMQAMDFPALDISSNRMRPVCLDAVARAFPGLDLILAHFLSLGRRDEAAALLLHHPNVYADLTTPSGATTKARVKAYARLLRDCWPFEDYRKLLFGTDFFTHLSGIKRLKAGIKAIGLLLDELKVAKEVRAQVMGGTAERLVGLSPQTGT
jgi:predicted TIM-barrel fold metal-dependent hydrolase